MHWLAIAGCVDVKEISSGKGVEKIVSPRTGYRVEVPVASSAAEPKLPIPVGPLSAAVLELLAGRPPRRALIRTDVHIGDADPYGLDLQLALHICYGLHFRGFAGVDDRWQWDPGLLHLRGCLEVCFEEALLREVGESGESETAVAELTALSVEPVDGEDLSHFLRDEGTWDQMREYFVHRSTNAVGVGDGDRPLRHRFAAPLRAAGLDPKPLTYLNHVPAESLAAANLIAMFGLHRSWRGAAAGHRACTEITRPPGARRMVQALQRVDAPQACVRFHAEQAESGGAHAATDVVSELLRREPHLDRDVVVGSRARRLIEERLSAHVMKSWVSGRSSLRRPLGRPLA